MTHFSCINKFKIFLAKIYSLSYLIPKSSTHFDVLQVQSVKLKPGSKTQAGCGIDGELLQVEEQVLCSMLPEQYRLIGRPAKHRV
jgi:hypothetical protein